MKTQNILLLLTTVGVLLFASPSRADLATLAPTQVIALSDVEGVARVAVKFDLSGLRGGDGRRIDIAMLDWSITGAESDAVSTFGLYSVTGAWTTEAVQARTGSVTLAESPSTSWEITPEEHADGLGGVVRFDVTSLAAGWAVSSSTNYGVVITTQDVSSSTLASQLSGIRLNVYYGFVSE